MFKKQDKKNQNGAEKEINDALLTKDEEIELAKIIAEEKTKLLNALVDIKCFGAVIDDLLMILVNLDSAFGESTTEETNDIANQKLLLILLKIREINFLYIKNPKAEHKEKLVNLLTEIDTIYIGNLIKACREKVYKIGDSMSRKELNTIEYSRIAIDDARCKMIMANQKLVISIAKNYVSSGLPLSDLIQEGNIGLIKAVDRYDYTTGYRFATYASHWIQQSLYCAISNQSYVASIPARMVDTIAKIKKASRLLTQQNGKVPSMQELAENLNMPMKKIDNILRITQEPIPFDTIMEESIEYEDALSLIDDAIETDLSEKIETALSTLSEREQLVIRMRFGLTNNDTHVLQEIGNLFGITHQHAKQNESVSAKKIEKSAVLH